MTITKRVSIVGTVGLPACYGGWETLVDNIVINKSQEVVYEIYCSTKNYSEQLNEYNGAKLTYIPLSANGLSSIFYDIFSLIDCWFKKPDVVLILGVSGCVFLPFFRVFSSAKIITNIDGIEWKRDKWNKLAKWFLKLSEKMAVNHSDIVISDNVGIANYVKKEYNVNTQVIAYGGDHALINTDLYTPEDYFFTVCRIEPENNVHIILDAFASADKIIKIIGNWNSSIYGRDLKNSYSQYKNIEILEPVYDLAILFEYRAKCIGYIHGHSVGGTNPSLVEIMHFGKNIFAFDCTYNRFTTEDYAHFFRDKAQLLALLKSDIKPNSVNAEMVKQIAKKRYTWDVITKQYELLYES
jgi:glycosyltransferase involved in cell wall biosynthesis